MKIRFLFLSHSNKKKKLPSFAPAITLEHFTDDFLTTDPTDGIEVDLCCWLLAAADIAVVDNPQLTAERLSFENDWIAVASGFVS